jgi:hypothetical protein
MIFEQNFIAPALTDELRKSWQNKVGVIFDDL